MRGFNHGEQENKGGAFHSFHEVVKILFPTGKDPIMMDKDEY